MTTPNVYAVALMGATAVATWVAGAFFLHYWRRTRDRFFVLFAIAFWMMTANRIALLVLPGDSEHTDLPYGLRLVAFTVILVAILDKNRGSRSSS